MKSLADDFAAHGCPLPWSYSYDHDTIEHADGGSTYFNCATTRAIVRPTLVAVNFHDRLVAALERGNRHHDQCPFLAKDRKPCDCMKRDAQLLADIAAARQEADRAK